MHYLQNNILSNNRNFVVGDSFTVADAYLHIVLSWFGYVGLELSKYPVADAYYRRICDLQNVIEAKSRMNSFSETTF
jgi:glutathione S-transferase